jgi:hypothetical protein
MKNTAKPEPKQEQQDGYMSGTCQRGGAMTKQQQIAALKAVGDAVIESVAAAGPLGCPGGILYAALMAHGCTLEQFEKLMDALVAIKQLVKRGELYFTPQTLQEKAVAA